MFVATTRFSLIIPKSGAWNISKSTSDIDEYKKILYEEKRLNFRINFIKNISLPLLEEASEGYDFLHIIEYSESLPEKYKSILKQLERRYDFLRLNVYDDNGSPESSTNEIITNHFKLKAVYSDIWIGQFRLDDDDCVSLDYFKIMSQYLNPCYETFYVSLGRGIVGIHDENYNFLSCAEMYKPKINIGFMNIGRYSHGNKKIYFTTKVTSHMVMDQVNRVILDSREIAFYWSRHQYQDTRLNKTGKQIDRVMNQLKELPPLEIEFVNSKFGENFIEKIKSFDKEGNFISI